MCRTQFSSVQSLSRVRLFETPWIAARQASLSITNTQSSLRLMSIESVMPSSHLILGHPLLLLPPIPPSIRVCSNESTLHIRWPKYWSFSFSIMTNLHNILKSRDNTLPTKVHLVKAMVYPVVMYGCESEWTPGDGDGQGGLACCDSWGRKESDTTERLNWWKAG